MESEPFQVSLAKLQKRRGREGEKGPWGQVSQEAPVFFLLVLLFLLPHRTQALPAFRAFF